MGKMLTQACFLKFRTFGTLATHSKNMYYCILTDNTFSITSSLPSPPFFPFVGAPPFFGGPPGFALGFAFCRSKRHVWSKLKRGQNVVSILKIQYYLTFAAFGGAPGLDEGALAAAGADADAATAGAAAEGAFFAPPPLGLPVRETNSAFSQASLIC